MGRVSATIDVFSRISCCNELFVAEVGKAPEGVTAPELYLHLFRLGKEVKYTYLGVFTWPSPRPFKPSPRPMPRAIATSTVIVRLTIKSFLRELRAGVIWVDEEPAALPEDVMWSASGKDVS